jgi:hypothetical protein
MRLASAERLPEKYLSAALGSSSSKTDIERNGPKKDVLEISLPTADVTHSGEKCACKKLLRGLR